MSRKVSVLGDRFLEDAKISVSLAVAASLCRGVRCALLPGGHGDIRLRVLRRERQRRDYTFAERIATD